MRDNIAIESASLLAVEGADEQNFFVELCSHLHINNIQIVDIGGKDQFPRHFPLLYKLENFDKIDRLGFIRDAESNPAEDAFASICDILDRLNLPVPARPNMATTGTSPRVGIFIMPDNTAPGMLENLCLETIGDLPVNQCLNDFIGCFSRHLPEDERATFNEPKARVQSYLATRSPIVPSLGIGAKKGYWNFDHPCFSDIRSFLTALFQ